jgi:DNA-binding MarR family transcriptional regulator
LRRALRRRVDRAGGISELTDAQRELVRLVRRNPGIRVGAAATELRLAGNSVSTLVSGLIAEGWICRESDPADGRAGLLHLTEMAQSRVAEWRDRREGILAAALGRLDPEDLRRLEAALEPLSKLIDLLEEET